MDRIEKELAKLTQGERSQIKLIILKLKNRDFRGLDIKKLKGRNDIFRVRKGDLRIIYRILGEKIFILAIERRSEKTYKF